MIYGLEILEIINLILSIYFNMQPLIITHFIIVTFVHLAYSLLSLTHCEYHLARDI